MRPPADEYMNKSSSYPVACIISAIKTVSKDANLGEKKQYKGHVFCDFICVAPPESMQISRHRK